MLVVEFGGGVVVNIILIVVWFIKLVFFGEMLLMVIWCIELGWVVFCIEVVGFDGVEVWVVFDDGVVEYVVG